MFKEPSLPKPPTEEIKPAEPEKRFVLSTDPIIVERVKELKRTIKEMKGVHPEILSLCMFGSMTKGTANKESDIDGHLFIDLEALPAEERSSVKNVIATKLDPKASDRISVTSLSKEKSQMYLDELKTKMSANLELNERNLEGFRVRPISEGIIDEHLENLAHLISEEESYPDNLKSWQSEEPKKGEGESWESFVGRGSAHLKNKPSQPMPAMASINLYAMFHLDVGGGIKKYRKMLIEKLEKRGEAGEKLWNRIIQKTIDFEVGYGKKGTKKFPETLAEAKAMYAE